MTNSPHSTMNVADVTPLCQIPHVGMGPTAETLLEEPRREHFQEENETRSANSICWTRCEPTYRVIG